MMNQGCRQEKQMKKLSGKKGVAWRARRRRRIVQAAFFVLVALISMNHFLAESGREIPILGSASLHAICPFGGVVSIIQFATDGTFAQKTHESSWILMWIGFGVALLFGPAFCGWICPFGTFQEWIGKIGQRIMKKRYNRVVPAGVDRVLRYARYGVLAWVVYMTAATGKLVFAEYDPYFTLFNLWTGEVAVIGYGIFAVVVLLSLVVERPFCKYACPYGAVLGVFNLFRIFGIKRQASTCIDCGLCDKSCPMNINVSGAGVIRDHQCITCLECTSEVSCPVDDTVVFQAGKGGKS